MQVFAVRNSATTGRSVTNGLRVSAIQNRQLDAPNMTDADEGAAEAEQAEHDGGGVVVEAKREAPDRRAIGRILGQMGWDTEEPCTGGQTAGRPVRSAARSRGH